MENRNIKFGWAWIFLGIITGMLMGLFAFNGPLRLSPELMNYSSLPRRLLRLAHISFFGLGFLNWMYGITLKTLSLKSSKVTSNLFIFGAITMALFLSISAFYEPFKYSLTIPATSIFIAVLLFCRQLFTKTI